MSLLTPHRKAQHGTGKAHIHVFGTQPHFNELSYTYPLKLLSPSLPCHREIPSAIAYVLSYGGGLVSGDRIDLSVEVEQGAGLVFLTQGSTKVFKSRTPADKHRFSAISPAEQHNTTSQHLTATLSPSSLFLLLPDPVTCFESASYTQIQTLRLAPSSSLVLLDWFTSGRMARGEEWAFERYYSRNEVFVGDKRVARDVMLLEQTPANQTGAHGLPTRKLGDRLAPYACYATLILIGPLIQPLITSFQSAYNLISQRQRSEPENLIWSYSPLTDGGACVVRVAGKETELVKDWLKARLEGLVRIYFNRVADEYPDVPPRRWDDEERFHPRYNVAPQTQVLALMQQPNGQGQQERWGLQARWCDPSSFSFKNPINARSEVVLEGTAPIWNSVRGDKHCIVLCEGYFEWHKRGQKRTPHYIKHPDNHLLLLAGFYEVVKTTPKPTYTCTILTTEANSQLAFLHDRMPVILDGRQAMRWLEIGDGKMWRGEVLEGLSKPYMGKLVCYEVPGGVGKVGNEDPSFVEPIAERKDGLKAMMTKMAQKPKAEKKPDVSTTKPREPTQVLSDSSDEDVKPKAEGSAPTSRRTGSSPAPHRTDSSPTKAMKQEPSSSRIESRPGPSTSRPREPTQVISDSSDEDVKPKTDGSSPASRRTNPSPAPRRIKTSAKPAKLEQPSPTKSTKREASSPVEIDLISLDSDSDNEVVIDESRKKRKVEPAPSTKPPKPKKGPSKKTINDFFGKKRAS
ncbi:hypothetical protein FRC07_011209 [Ceratobasidium sp. 392]|nr:hypothetical protein FRC07_011209 [Ceratobasidium sp. 392]